MTTEPRTISEPANKTTTLPPRTRPLTVLHTADCHVGAGGGCEESFLELIEFVAREHCDAMVIAGDLFDHGRVDQSLVDWVGYELGRLERPVVILPGNHDLHGAGSIYERFDTAARYPRVHVLGKPEGELVELSQLELTVWGRPVLDHSPAFRPLLGVPPRPGQGWSIILGHGTVKHTDEPTLEGSPIYPRDLAVIDWDYLALGHIPRHLEVKESPIPACYSGITSKGACIVEFSTTLGTSVTWRSFGD